MIAMTDSGTRFVTLNFKRKELLYDASNYSFVEGDLMPEEQEHNKHQVIDICQDGNIDRITRVLNLAVSECNEMLYPYTKQEIPDNQNSEFDNVLNYPESYTIVMEVPKTFSMSTVELLKNLLHEYLVCRLMADWMSITKPQSETLWEKKIAYTKNKIQTCLVSRIKPVRRRTMPF